MGTRRGRRRRDLDASSRVGVGRAVEQEPQGRHLPRRLGVDVRVDRQLRSDGRVPRQLVRDQHEPARPRRSSATTTSPVPPGNILVPDLATTVPKPTNGGSATRSTSRTGIKFGPPVNREITSKDVKYALERHGTAEERGAVRLLLHRDQGLGRVRQGQDEVDRRASRRRTRRRSSSTSRLRRVTSAPRWRCRRRDPIPQEVAKCFEGKPGAYGRDVIASGPYMIEGL